MIQRIIPYRGMKGSFTWECECGGKSQVVQSKSYTVRNAQAHVRNGHLKSKSKSK